MLLMRRVSIREKTFYFLLTSSFPFLPLWFEMEMIISMMMMMTLIIAVLESCCIIQIVSIVTLMTLICFSWKRLKGMHLFAALVVEAIIIYLLKMIIILQFQSKGTATKNVLKWCASCDSWLKVWRSQGHKDSMYHGLKVSRYTSRSQGLKILWSLKKAEKAL